MKAVHILRKPLTGTTVVANILVHGCGGLNIDAARVETVSAGPGSTENGRDDALFGGGIVSRSAYDGSKGRWPANVVFQHLPGCKEAGTKQVKGSQLNQVIHRSRSKSLSIGAQTDGFAHGYTDPLTGTETVAAWACAPGCPCAALDAQSGVLHARGNQGPTKRGSGGIFWAGNGNGVDPPRPELKDTGGASRFFKKFGGTLR